MLIKYKTTTQQKDTPRDVLLFPTDKQRLALHPTQTPEDLVEYFVKTYTEEGDIVLDPCRGSNTTGVVCDRLKRGVYWSRER